jgi:microsomal epoxide hydrolase
MVPGWIPFHEDPKLFNQKPMAYSWFPKEIMPVPRAFVDAQGLNLVHYKQHASVCAYCHNYMVNIQCAKTRLTTEQGGHFAAFEKPKEIVQDVDDFIKKIGWPLK